jgi:hypothetical protein
MTQPADRPAKPIEQHVEICAHCGAENPPGLLLCLVCGRNPPTGRDLFAAPEVPMPGEAPPPPPAPPPYQMSVVLPAPIQVPDPLPIPSLEDFVAPPAPSHLIPPLVYRAASPPPTELKPVLSPAPRWIIGLLGLGLLLFLGLGAAGSLAGLNLPGGLCLGSVWLAVAVVWAGILLARRGEVYNRYTGARRRLARSLGLRLFEVTPGPAKERRAQMPAVAVPPFAQPASHLVYLSGAGDRAGQLRQVLLGTLCALAAADHVDLAGQTYDVLTASPFSRKVQTVNRTAVFRRILYVGSGYLEKLILKQLGNAPSGARELVAEVLRQAGGDLLQRIAAEAGQAAPPGTGATPNLDAQLAALRAFCAELQRLNPALYETLSREVEEAVREAGGLVGTRRNS